MISLVFLPRIVLKICEKNLRNSNIPTQAEKYAIDVFGTLAFLAWSVSQPVKMPWLYAAMCGWASWRACMALRRAHQYERRTGAIQSHSNA